MNALKKEFCIVKYNFLQMALITLGIYALGTAVSTGIVLALDSTEYISVGLILAFVGSFICALVAGAQLYVGFDMAVGMSVSRKRYFATSYVSNYFLVLVCFAVARVLAIFDEFFAKVVAPTAEYILDVSGLGFVNYIVLVLFASFVLTSGAMFVGALLHKWGKKAFWTLWVIWMIGCVGLPQMADRQKNNPIFIAIGNFFSQLFQMRAWQWCTLAIVVSGLLTAISWLVLRKEKVN